MERLAKDMRSVFSGCGFKITIEAGLKRVEFLDVILDLNNDSYRPFKKPNTETIYMSNESNHPGYIKKQIPNMVNQRLNMLSKSKSEFDFVKENYQDALKKSKFTSELTYKENPSTSSNSKKKRRRKIIYFQPPFSHAVKTPIGRLFLKLVKKHFKKDNSLYKILNEKCLKLSYCCEKNIKSEIAAHNRKIRSSTTELPAKKLCNCRSKGDPCPLDGKCQLSNLVYSADIQSCDSDHKIYLGTTGTTFKERYANHKSSFRHKKKQYSTELSKYYWKLKDEGKNPSIKWSVVRRIKCNFDVRSGCSLCSTERYELARANKDKLLNVRNERKRICPHYASLYF